jgi:hypothetical protein
LSRAEKDDLQGKRRIDQLNERVKLRLSRRTDQARVYDSAEGIVEMLVVERVPALRAFESRPRERRAKARDLLRNLREL